MTAAIGNVTAINDSNMIPAKQVTLGASDTHIGSLGGNTAFINTALTLDTAIYATGDVLADTQPITGAMRVADKTGVLQSLVITDEDDQGIAFDLVFLSGNVSIGTENAAVSITDINSEQILGILSIAATDFIDLGGCRIATKQNIGIIVKPNAGTSDVYVAAISRGAGTYTATGIKIRFGFMQD